MTGAAACRPRGRHPVQRVVITTLLRFTTTISSQGYESAGPVPDRTVGSKSTLSGPSEATVHGWGPQSPEQPAGSATDDHQVHGSAAAAARTMRFPDRLCPVLMETTCEPMTCGSRRRVG